MSNGYSNDNNNNIYPKKFKWLSHDLDTQINLLEITVGNTEQFLENTGEVAWEYSWSVHRPLNV